MESSSTEQFYPHVAFWTNVGFSTLGCIMFVLFGMFRFWRRTQGHSNRDFEYKLAEQLKPSRTKTGVILQAIRFVLGFVSLALFNTRADFLNFPLPLWHVVLEILLAIFFTVLSCVRLMANPSLAKRAGLSWQSVAVLFGTSSLIFASLAQFADPETANSAFGRQRLSFQFLLVFESFDAYRNLGPTVSNKLFVRRSEIRERVMLLIFEIILIVTCFGCLIFCLEVLGDPELLSPNADFVLHPDQRNWTLGSALYFIVVTISTVGYGDISAQTILGRIAVCLIIVAGITFFGFATGEILSLIQGQRTGTARLVLARNVDFVLLTGDLTNTAIEMFLFEFFRPSHGTGDSKVVILAPDGVWSHEQQLFLSDHPEGFGAKVIYLKGSVLDDVTLHRVRAHDAQAYFVITNPFFGDDSQNIMRSLHLRLFDPHVPIFCILKEAANRSLLICSGVHPDRIVCVDEMKYGTVAQSCIAPGSGALLRCLMGTGFSTYVKDNSSLGERLCSITLEGLVRSSQMTILEINAPVRMVGKTFREFAALLWDEHEGAMIGEIRDRSYAPRRSRVGSQYSDTEHDESVEYDPLVFENNCDLLPYDPDAKVSARTTVVIVASASAELAELGRGLNTLTLHGRTERVNQRTTEWRIQQNDRLLPMISIGQTFSAEKTVRAGHVAPPATLRNHIVLGYHPWSMSNGSADLGESKVIKSLLLFLRPLVSRIVTVTKSDSNSGQQNEETRKVHQLSCPVVVLADHLPLLNEWGRVSMFRPLYFVQGKTTELEDLMRAGLHTAKSVVMMHEDRVHKNYRIRDGDVEVLMDNHSIFSQMVIESRFLHVNPSLETGVSSEFLAIANLQLLSSTTQNFEVAKHKTKLITQLAIDSPLWTTPHDNDEIAAITDKSTKESDSDKETEQHEENKEEEGGNELNDESALENGSNNNEEESTKRSSSVTEKDSQHKGHPVLHKQPSAKVGTGTSDPVDVAVVKRDRMRRMAIARLESTVEILSDERYASGRVHLASTMSSLVAMAYLRPRSISVLRQLITDSTRWIVHEDIPHEYSNSPYRMLVFARIQDGKPPPLGLWCTPHPRRQNEHAYAIANPNPEMLIRQGDKIFVLASRNIHEVETNSG